MHLDSLLTVGQNFGQTMQIRITSSWVSREVYHKNKVDWPNTFMRMSITIYPAQYNQMLHNGYLLVELRRLVYNTLLEGSGPHVALGDNVLLTCTVNNHILFFLRCSA